MAAVSRAVVCQDEDNRMTYETDHSLTPTAKQPRRPPVRLKLRRVNANLATAYPPDGESKVWWKRLKKALGTASSAFVNASLLQLQAAAQLPCGGISETATNAALALIEGAAPRNEIEGGSCGSNGLHARGDNVGPREVPGWRWLRAPGGGARNGRGSTDAGLFSAG